MVVSKTPPIYPAAAKAAGVSGVVQLSAIIGKDGTVQELEGFERPAGAGAGSHGRGEAVGV